MRKRTILGTLQLVHRVLLTGLVLFIVIAVVLIYQSQFIPSLAGLDKTLQLIAVGLSATAVFAGAAIFKKKIQQARDNSGDIAVKMVIYRSACIIQWALLEGASLFSIVCFLLTGNLAYIALAGTLVLWLALTIPSKTKLMLLLGLNEQQLEEAGSL